MALKFNGKYGGSFGTTKQFDYSEDDYLASIEQYRGTDFYDQLLNNPYLTDANSYAADWWQSNVAEGLFGDTSRRENWYAEMARNRDEYKAEILKKMSEAQHNSTAAQVARDQQAGLNPDLTGVSSAGQIQAAPQDENPPGAPEPMDASGPLSAVGSFATTLFESVMKFGSWIQGLRSAGLDNDLKELDLFTKFNDVVPKTDVEGEEYRLPKLSPDAEKKGYTVDAEGHVHGPDGNIITGEGQIDEDDPEILNSILDTIDAAIAMPKAANADGLIAKNKLFGSQRLRRFTKAVRDNYPDRSLKKGKLREESKKEILEAHQGQAQVLGDTYYDPDPVKYGANIADFIENVDKRMSKLKRDTQAAIKRATEAEADYTEELYEKDEEGNVIVGKAEREARVAAAQKEALFNKVDSIVDEEVDKWSADLKEKGTWWSSALRLVLPQIRNGLKENYIHDLMTKFSFGREETTTTTGPKGGVTTTQKFVK